MNNKTFLDIDDTILTKKWTLPENAAKDDFIMKQPESKAFFIIQPMPGVCVKAKTEDGEKIFVNICTSDKIPPPEDISDAKLFEIACATENLDYVMPMSIGTERIESDKDGRPCVTYDVAVNATYLEKCREKKMFLLFTVSVVLDGVASKFNKTFNREDYVILKNRKVIGKLQQHKIENRKPRGRLQAQKPLIEELKPSVKSSPKTKSTSSEKKIENNQVNSKSNYVLLKQPLEGAATHLIGLFKMPKGITGVDVHVLLDQDRIVITVDNSTFAYDLSIPYAINIAQVKCSLDKDLKILRLDMPVQDAVDNTERLDE